MCPTTTNEKAEGKSVNDTLSLYSKQRRLIQLQKGWTRLGDGESTDARHSESSKGSSLDFKSEKEEGHAVKRLMAQLSERFHELGWSNAGNGGGLTIRIGGGEQKPWRVFVTPGGVLKENMIAEDIFELDSHVKVTFQPETPNLQLSSHTSLWFLVYQHRPSATCVIHINQMDCTMATLIDDTSSSLKLTHLEMIKGIPGHAYHDVLEIPIIENQTTEAELAPSLTQALNDYPKSNAVLVRRQGMYVWGDSWEQAKTQAECLVFCLKCAVQAKLLGMDFSQPPPAATTADKKEDATTDDPPKKKRKLEESSGSTSTANNDNNGKSPEELEREGEAAKALMAQLSEYFYQKGWATGTSGGLSIRVGGRVFATPSGVQKEDMIGDDIFELDMNSNVIQKPITPNLRLSASTSLWYVVYHHRPKATCVIHTHDVESTMATLLDPTEQCRSLKLTPMEGHETEEEVPVIDNRPTEPELAPQMNQALGEDYPNCSAVLVRRHGMYVWGDSWEQAKALTESLSFRLKCQVQAKLLGR